MGVPTDVAGNISFHRGHVSGCVWWVGMSVCVREREKERQNDLVRRVTTLF